MSTNEMKADARCYRQQMGMEENLQRLYRVLLRIQATVEEAEGRHITNQAMLQQLQMLREAMYKGYYLLDTFTYRMLQQKRANYLVSGHPFAFSIFHPTKRLCSSTRRMDMVFQGDGLKELQKMLGSLHSIIDDMAEFIIFLKSYPPIYREPYNMHLFLENCMFGRQVEMEKIINFLLQSNTLELESLQVLPIVGPPRVGKSTLVEHVCYDERVCNNFSSIIIFRGDPIAALEGNCVVKKQSPGSHGRSLVIMDLAGDLAQDERQCKRLYSLGSHMRPGSKVIITSRSENIVKLGTTITIRLKHLPQEAYWYFFKVLAFGSTNPKDHTELASIAMEIAAGLDGSFLGALTIGSLLRDNLHTRFWHKILELERESVYWNNHFFGEHRHSLLQQNQNIYFTNMSKIPVSFKAHYCEKQYNQTKLPKIMLYDVWTGRAKAHGNFEAVMWKSRIPPWHSYLMSCEEAPQRTMDKKKRPHYMVS